MECENKMRKEEQKWFFRDAPWSFTGFVTSAMTLMTKLMYRDTLSCCFPICVSMRSLRIFTNSSWREESNRSWGKQEGDKQTRVQFPAQRKICREWVSELPSTECHWRQWSCGGGSQHNCQRAWECPRRHTRSQPSGKCQHPVPGLQRWKTSCSTEFQEGRPSPQSQSKKSSSQLWRSSWSFHSGESSVNEEQFKKK